MSDEPEMVVCPACSKALAVQAAWRMVECPHCRNVITRMGDDASYD